MPKITLKAPRYFCLGILFLAAALPAFSQSRLVISQVYGGGNSGATYKNGFIELFNAGDTAQNLAGWTVQYGSSLGTTWTPTPLTGTIQPGHYLLVKEGAGAGGTVDLPAPDVSGNTDMSATAGKVALVRDSAALTEACPTDSIVDFVGYGAANCYEGAPAPVLTDTTGVLRVGAGCTDGNWNGTDFTATAPTPRNSSAATQTCIAIQTFGRLSAVSQNEGNSGTTPFDFVVKLNLPATSPVTFNASTQDGTAISPLDYTALSNVPFTIAAGQQTATVTVLVNGDTVVENNESFTVVISAISGASPTLPSLQVPGLILNDDIANPNLSFSPSSLPAGSAGVPYSQVLIVTNGDTCTFSTSGPVPPGLSLVYTGLTNTATLSGIPTSSGTFRFTVSAGCAIGSVSQTYSVIVINPNLSFSPSSLPAGSAGVMYSQVITVTNGGTCRFTTSGTVPPGLALSSTGLTNTATLVGIPSSSGTFGFSVNANCTNGSALQAYSVNIANPNLSFSPSSLPAGMVGMGYSQVLAVTNGGACTFATSGTVPPGLNLSSTGLTNTATLSGIPTSSGTFGFTVGASCANGSVSQDYSINVANANLSFSPSSLPAGTAGVPYSQMLTVINGGACTFATSGIVPPGLNLSSTGLTNTATLSGTPTSSGTFGFTVGAGCANGLVSQAYSVNIANANLSFSPSSLPGGTAGVGYSQVLTVTNGNNCTFTTSGTVPPGLSLGSTGLTNTATLSGTPTSSGAFGFTVGASCANGSVSQAYSVNIANANLSFSPSLLPAGTAGVPYSQLLTVTNGDTCKFSTSGTVPPGLNLGSTGLTNTATLSGTPSSSGTFGFTVSASCANGSVSQAYSVNIANANLSFSPSSLPAGTAGVGYSQVLTVTNGDTCKFSTSGTPPPGLSLGSTGLTNTATLSGTPSTSGTFAFAVSASCANGSVSQAYSVNVAGANLSFSPSSLSAGTAGVVYSQVLTVTNGDTCKFSTSGTTPPGLNLSSTGLTNTATLSGTPSSPGTFGFTVNASCANGSVSQAYSVNVANANLSFNPSSLSAGTVGVVYSQVLTVTNGNTCTFSTSGTPPPGLNLSSTGLTNTATLSGTPSSSGTFGFSVNASCANGSVSQAYSVNVVNANLSFSPSSLPAGTVGVVYSQVLTVTNGNTCTFTISGTVPPGLSLGSTGLTNTATLSGTPTSSGAFGFTVGASCAIGSVSQAYSVNIANANLSFSPSSLPAGTAGVVYSQVLTVTNGDTCKFSASGTTPPGLNLGSTGLTNTATLSGTPSSSGTFGFTVSASCANGSVSQAYSVNIANANLSFSPSSLPAGTVGVVYSQVLTVTNGNTCTFSTSGTVPSGLNLGSTGLTNTATLSGTPTSSGAFGFTVSASCANGSVSQAYSVNIANANLSFSPSSLPAGTVGLVYSQLLTITNGNTCTFSTSGTVPSGLNLGSTGLTNTATLSGTPTSSGAFGFTVSASCANGSVSQAYSVNIANANLSFSPSSLPAGTVGLVYSQVLTVTNGNTCTFSTSGTVPPGLNLGSTGLTNTATLNGTPTSSGAFGLTVSASCANGSVSQAYLVNVADATLSFSPSSLPAGTEGILYSQVLTVTNGNTCTFSTSGTVPPGLNLGSTGLTNTATLNGTPTSSGAFGLTVSASCANGSVSQAYLVNVADATLSFSPSSLPAGTEGILYSQVLTVTNGGACTFSTSGTVPPGLTLSSTGLTNTATLSGTPSSSGTFGFTVSANCANGSVSQVYSVDFAFACETGVKTSTAIHTIQGSGTLSPMVGQTAEVEGIVVGDFQASTQLRGFYLQEPDATWDSDPTTSEGIFIFDNLVGAAVNIGDRVRVRGLVTELPGAGKFLGSLNASSLTEIGPVAAKMVCSSGNSFTVTTVTLPAANVGDLERYEGMAVQITQQLTVTGNINLGTTGSIDLAPSQLYAPTSSTDQSTWPVNTSLNQRSVVGLDDGSGLSNVNLFPTLFPQGGLSDANTLRDGALVNYDSTSQTNSPLVGVLDDRLGEYRIQPTAVVTFYNANARPAIAPILANTGSRFRAASANVLNFFTTLGSKGAATQTEFNNQKTKIIDELSGMNADLYGLSEVQNFANGNANGGTYTNTALQSLVDGLNCKFAGLSPLCATPPAAPYALIDTLSLGANNGTDAIRSAIIYNPSVLTPVGGPAAYYQNDANRPTLAQTFKPTSGTKTDQQTFTFVVNHFRAKGGAACGGTSDDIYQGNCNGMRLSMAQNVTTWLGGNPTGDPAGATRRILQVGDFNAYYGEDPIQYISTNGYTNLIAAILGPAAYSFSLGSQAGYLDHTMANAAMNVLVKSVGEWHNNADEPPSLQALNSASKSPAAQVAYYGDDPYAASDHDPIVIGFNTLAGDLNDDGVVDMLDQALMMNALNKPASSVDHRMDLDGDGRITTNDVRLWWVFYRAYAGGDT